MQQINDILQRISGKENVEGYLVTNFDGEIIKTSFSNNRKEFVENMAECLPDIVFKAKDCIKFIEPKEELDFLRL